MRASTCRELLRALASACTVLLATTARAADPAAETLFHEAVALMKKGDFAAACPKLEASQRREARSGTLLNLASCREHEGKTATAWALYKEAATLARSENRREHADKAATLAAALEPKLSRLRVDVAGSVPGQTVTVDGVVLDRAMFGTSVPVDPGPHEVSASAPGHGSWSGKVTVDAAQGAHSVSVPMLEEEAATPAGAATADARPDGGVPTWAWIAGGAGVALVAASIVFRVDQSSAAATLDDECGEDRKRCPPKTEYDYESDQARERRDFALFVGLGAAGVAALGVAVVGIVTAPSKPDTARLRFTPTASVDRSKLTLGMQGRFE